MVISPFIGLGLAVFIIYKAVRAKGELDKYEFENTTDGGVVQFPNYEASKRHRIKRNMVTMSPMFAIMAIVAGLMLWK